MLALPCPADDSPGPVRRPHGLSPLTSASRSVPRAPHVAGTGGRLPRNTLAASDRAATGNRQVVRGRSRHRPRRCARACPGGHTLPPGGLLPWEGAAPGWAARVSTQSSWHAHNQRRAEAPQERQPGCSHPRLRGPQGEGLAEAQLRPARAGSPEIRQEGRPPPPAWGLGA